MFFRQWPLAIIGSLFLLPAFASVSVKDSGTQKIYSIQVEGVKTEKVQLEGQSFTQVKLEGVQDLSGVRYVVGAPEVPVIRLYVNADSASDIEVIVRGSNKKNTIKSISNIRPNLPSLEKVSFKKYSNTDLKVTKSYSHPTDFYSIELVGVQRGEKQFLVTLYPLEYQRGELSLENDSFQVVVRKNDEANFPFKANDGIVFIIGAKFAQSAELEKYIAFKQRLGFTVFRSNIAKGTTSEKIREALQKLYKDYPELKYVLIVGDAEDVPAKVSTTISGITDHYYASLDANYDSDVNTPELQVGRISAINNDQLAIILNKYTRYVETNFSAENWMRSVSFLATNNRYTVAEGTHNYVIDTYTKEKGFRGIFPQNGQAGGDQLYAITHRVSNDKVQAALGLGRTIIDYSGHGANTFWDAPRVSQADVRALKSSSYPFVISNACITGDFRVAESFAETWQRHEFGAIMFWGSMDSTYWDEDDILERRMFDGIFTQKKLAFGEITDFALSEHWRHYGGGGRAKYYWETYHMFGDPSVKLKTFLF